MLLLDKVIDKVSQNLICNYHLSLHTGTSASGAVTSLQPIPFFQLLFPSLFRFRFRFSFVELVARRLKIKRIPYVPIFVLSSSLHSSFLPSFPFYPFLFLFSPKPHIANNTVLYGINSGSSSSSSSSSSSWKLIRRPLRGLSGAVQYMHKRVTY